MKKGLFLLLAVFLLGSLYAYDYEEKIAKTFTLPTSGSFELSNINGDIIVSTHSQNSVIVDARKTADSKTEADKVEIVFEHDTDRLKIYVKRHCKRCNVRVNFVVKLPEKINSAYLKSINGKVEAKGGFSHLRAKSINGRLDFRGITSGARFSAINGKILVSLTDELAGDLTLDSINGSITLELDKDSSFRVSGSTLNGSIRCDFPISLDSGIVGAKISGSVNDGKYRVKANISGRKYDFP